MVKYDTLDTLKLLHNMLTCCAHLSPVWLSPVWLLEFFLQPIDYIKCKNSLYFVTYYVFWFMEITNFTNKKKHASQVIQSSPEINWVHPSVSEDNF